MIKIDICNVTKIFISNKFCAFKLCIHDRILKKCITVSTKSFSSTTDFQKIFLDQHIMISEGSCDTEVMAADISFDVTEINYLLKYIKILFFLF